MAQRTVALCDGKYVGIESIYTVVNGCQINIPDRLKKLRAKSQNNELFCPCGCGANLILVAGDKNLREQHFRIKDADAFQDCHMVTEGKTSVDSKIVLKCWLDENLRAEDLESRVPISAVSDSSRKYEFTFISRSAGIALNYCHDRVNLSDEKLSILEENSRGIRIIHVVDFLNGGSDGQYPYGNRWIKCEYCGKIAKDTEFSSYGGAIGVHLNLGTCKECSANNPAAKPSYHSEDSMPKRAYNPTVCPECGSKLVEKNGRNGRFIGCSGYPRCRYTRSIR